MAIRPHHRSPPSPSLLLAPSMPCCRHCYCFSYCGPFPKLFGKKDCCGMVCELSASVAPREEMEVSSIVPTSSQCPKKRAKSSQSCAQSGAQSCHHFLSLLNAFVSVARWISTQRTSGYVRTCPCLTVSDRGLPVWPVSTTNHDGLSFLGYFYKLQAAYEYCKLSNKEK